jgi:transcriptional regulator with XRE-family HTH domain
MNQIGPRVRELREKGGMSQEQFTARCNLVGFNISRGTLAKIESQVRRITDEEVGLLAKALKVDVSVLYVNPDIPR